MNRFFFFFFFFFFSSRRRHTRLVGDWSSDVCSSDLSLVSALTDGAMWSWEVRSGKGAAISAAAGTRAMVALGADGRNAFIARDDGAALLWDIAARRELKRFSAPASAVTAVALSSEAHLALVAADGQRLRLWSIRE